jgi:predicted nucleic acid-binding protein
VVDVPEPPPAVPACRDPLDVPFLHLAVADRAQARVSGDRDLLALAGARGICPALTVEILCAQYLSA